MKIETPHMDADHLTPEQISRFARPSESFDAERSRANLHIQSCATCRAAFQQALRPVSLASLLGEYEEAECLDAGLLSRYAAGAADAVERDLVEMHLETCALCRADVAALAAVPETSEKSEKPKQPIKPTPIGLVAALHARLLAWFEVCRQKSGLAMGGAALAGAVITFLLLLPRVRPPHTVDNAEQTARLMQAAQAAQVRQEELARQNQQAQAALQAAQQAATAERQAEEQEKASHRATQQALADARQQLTRLKATPPARLPAAAAFPFTPLSSEQVVVDSRGNAAYVIPLDPKESRVLRSASPGLPGQQLASLAKKGGTTMGGTGEEPIALLRPGGTFVGSLRPAFTWKAVPQAREYKLTCIPQDSGSVDSVTYRVPADAASTSLMAWSIPARSPALQADTTYTWTVEALDAQANTLARSSRHEEILFRTLTAAQLDEVKRKSRQYADNPLLMGVLYARLGVLEQADQALARCLAANPANQEARRLQKQVRQAMHP